MVNWWQKYTKIASQICGSRSGAERMAAVRAGARILLGGQRAFECAPGFRESHGAVLGRSGSRVHTTNASRIAGMPSTTNSHCQPWKPSVPSSR